MRPDLDRSETEIVHLQVRTLIASPLPKRSGRGGGWQRRSAVEEEENRSMGNGRGSHRRGERVFWRLFHCVDIYMDGFFFVCGKVGRKSGRLDESEAGRRRNEKFIEKK